MSLLRFSFLLIDYLWEYVTLILEMIKNQRNKIARKA